MRKILLCLSTIVLCVVSSCTKDTTYTFQNIRNWPEDSSDILPEISFFLEEYDNTGEIVANHCISFAESKSKQEFTASDFTEIVRVRTQYKTVTTWVNQIHYVEKGKTIDIIIDDGTSFVSDRP